MGAVSSKLRSLAGGRLAFMCPGCKSMHQVSVADGCTPKWRFNGDHDRPTFTPSILVTWTEPSNIPDEFDDLSKDHKMVCHSFVTDGRIQFLSDCTHALAGNTVDIPDLNEAL